MSILYLLTLLVSIGGMVVLDWRLRLFFWKSPGRAAAVLGIGLAFFLAWDLAGISLRIFHRGETTVMTGVLLAPDLPIEEFFFLAFLCYLTMNLFGAVALLRHRRRRS